MGKINNSSLEYENAVSLYSELINVNKEFPDDVFKRKGYKYILSFLSVSDYEEEVNLHVLLMSFLKMTNQSEYYLMPLSIDMSIIEDLPILKFNNNDSSKVYMDFWKNEQNKEVTKGFFYLPDGYLLFNKTLEWFYYEDRNLTLSMFAFLKEDLILKFSQIIRKMKSYFCNISEAKYTMQFAYDDKGKELFNRWILKNLANFENH